MLVQALARHLKEVEAALSAQPVAAVFRCANRRPPQERGSQKAPRGHVPGRHAGRNRFRTVDGALGGGPQVLAGGGLSRPGVQTQHIGTIADITAEDCRTLDAAMTKCSKWLPGHDQAAAARAAVPEPAEVKADIEALGNRVAAIRNRRW